MTAPKPGFHDPATCTHPDPVLQANLVDRLDEVADPAIPGRWADELARVELAACGRCSSTVVRTVIDRSGDVGWPDAFSTGWQVLHVVDAAEVKVARRAPATEAWATEPPAGAR